MYIEFCFRIDNQDNFYYLIEQTRLYLDEWSQLYDVQFQQKLVKYCLRLCFFEDRFYDFFMMTFDRSILNYKGITMKLILDPNNRQ